MQHNSLYGLQTAYYYERSWYSNSFEEIGFIQEKREILFSMKGILIIGNIHIQGIIFGWDIMEDLINLTANEEI